MPTPRPPPNRPRHARAIFGLPTSAQSEPVAVQEVGEPSCTPPERRQRLERVLETETNASCQQGEHPPCVDTARPPFFPKLNEDQRPTGSRQTQPGSCSLSHWTLLSLYAGSRAIAFEAPSSPFPRIRGGVRGPFGNALDGRTGKRAAPSSPLPGEDGDRALAARRYRCRRAAAKFQLRSPWRRLVERKGRRN